LRQSPRATQSRGSTTSNKHESALAQFKQSFSERFRARLYMTLLLSAVCLSGLLASKLLFELGLRSMLVRYLIAVSVSYVVFFFLIRVLLWYITGSATLKPTSRNPDKSDVTGRGLIAFDWTPGDMSAPGDGLNGPLGEGGDFGGGGATDMWGDSPNAAASVQGSGASGASRGQSGTGGGGFDFGDDAIVLIALAVLVVVIFGAGAYLVYAAPDIISEATFQALLAAGLIKGSAKVTRRGWMGSVLRTTCVPFLIVLLMTGVFGWVAHKHYPKATRLADIFKSSSEKR
jgi:hypothetical protein